MIFSTDTATDRLNPLQARVWALVFAWSSAALVIPAAAQQPSAPADAPPPAQTAAPVQLAPPPKELASPHATMMTFLDAMNRAADAAKAGNATRRNEALDRAVSCLDLSSVNKERTEILASRLLGVLNRLGEYRGQLPDQYMVADATEVQYFPHSRFADVVASVEPRGSIVLTRQGDGRWLFSADTMAGVDELYLSMESLPILIGVDEGQISSDVWLRRLMPATLKGKTLLTLEYWQWAALLVFVFLGVVLDHVFRLIVRAISRRLIERQGGQADPTQMKLTVRPAGLTVMALFWLNLVWILGLPDLAYTVIQGAARVFAVLACTFFAWRMTDLTIDALLRKAQRTHTKFDDVLLPLIRTTTRIFIVLMAVIYGAQALDIPIGPLLGALGIGGVGFAFAAKDTLENFFGSATVLIDQPFGVGDWVVVGDVEGTVETIGFRSTRIRTFYNSLVTVPNANLVRATVDNYGRRKYRRWKTNVGVQYDTTPEKLVAFIEGIRELVRTHPYTRKDYFQVYLNGFGASSLDILLYVFHETPDWSTELRERERLMLDIIRLADQLEVQFAFPTQTIHLYQEQHGLKHAPEDAPTSMTDRRSMVSGIRAAQKITAGQLWQKETPGPVSFRSGPTKIDGDDETFIEDRTSGA